MSEPYSSSDGSDQYKKAVDQLQAILYGEKKKRVPIETLMEEATKEIKKLRKEVQDAKNAFGDIGGKMDGLVEKFKNTQEKVKRMYVAAKEAGAKEPDPRDCSCTNCKCGDKKNGGKK